MNTPFQPLTGQEDTALANLTRPAPGNAQALPEHPPSNPPHPRSSSPTVLLVKGLISELPPADQQKVHTCADQMRQIIAAGGAFALVALALVGAETQDDSE